MVKQHWWLILYFDLAACYKAKHKRAEAEVASCLQVSLYISLLYSTYSIE